MSFLQDTSGNVAILSALSLPIVIGIAGLVTEYGLALADRAEGQRVADLAAYAAANAYAVEKSSSRMKATAFEVGAMNGVGKAAMTVELVPAPDGRDGEAVKVTITRNKPLFLSAILTDERDLKVAVNSYAQVGSEQATPGNCILALDSGSTGVTLSGGTKIAAPSCTVSSNSTVTVPCGTSITAKAVTYDSGQLPSQPCSGIKGPGNDPAHITRQHTADPFEGDAAIAAAAGRLAQVASMKYPFAPDTPAGGNIDFGWDQNATRSQAAAVGCTATWSQPKWTLDCGSKQTVNFGNVTVGGGISVDFNLGSSANTVQNFSGSIISSGASMRFGGGTFNIAKGLVSKGGAATSFGAGTFVIGGGTDTTCGARYSICNTSTLSFDGPSTFKLAAGVSTSGGSTLVMGAGKDNSFEFGPSSSGLALNVDGGAMAKLADAVGRDSAFKMVGDLKTSGGSCLIAGAATHHDFAGSLSISGGAIFGAGSYTVDGYFALGENGGGNVNCEGRSVSLDAKDVTLVVSGTELSRSGSCKDNAFCVAAGYRDLRLEAPSEGSTARLAVIGPQRKSNSGGAAFTEGGSNAQIAGAFYFPNGPVTFNGGASALGSLNDPTACFQIVGSRVTLAGGTSAASECVGGAVAGGKTGKKVSLIR